MSPLKVWRKAIDIAEKVYTVTAGFPKHELYGLAGQMRRASISIGSNIAEGFAREHPKEYRHYLHIALGSCAEPDTQLVICHRMKYIDDKELDELSEDINHEARMLNTLAGKVSPGLRTSNERPATSDQRRATSDEQ